MYPSSQPTGIILQWGVGNDDSAMHDGLRADWCQSTFAKRSSYQDVGVGELGCLYELVLGGSLGVAWGREGCAEVSGKGGGGRRGGGKVQRVLPAGQRLIFGVNRLGAHPSHQQE